MRIVVRPPKVSTIRLPVQSGAPIDARPAHLSISLRKKKLSLPIALATLFLGACASFTPGLGFEDVHRVVSERTSENVSWQQGTSVGQEIRDRLQTLLGSTLSVDAAVQVALLNNPELQATFEELGVAQADMVEAGLVQNPLLQAGARFSDRGTALEFSVVQSILDLFYRSTRKRIGAAGFEAAKLRVVGSVLDLVGDTRIAFYTLQAATQLGELRQTALTASDASFELARKIYAAGNMTELDLSNEEIMYEQSKLELSSAELQIVEGRKRLAALMGLSDEQTTKWRIDNSLPEIPKTEQPLDGLEEQAVEQSIELGILRREIEAAKARTDLVGPYATFGDVGMGVSSQKEVEGSRSTGPAISLPIPLFSQGQTARGRAWAELRSRQEHLKAVVLSIRSEASTVRVRVQNARELASRYKNIILPLRHRITEETQRHYNAMLVGAFRLLQAKQAEVMGETRYVQELHNYWSARSDMQQLLSGCRIRSQVTVPENIEGTGTFLNQQGQ